jgi:hypothetical protein
VEIIGTPSAPDNDPPATPTGLVATPGDSQIILDWADNTEQDLAGYNVYRSMTAGEPYTKINAALVQTSDYVDSSVANGTTYYYVVTAVDLSSNEGSYSGEVSSTPIDMPPAAPTGLVATPGASQVSLNWNDNGEADVVGYNVYRRTEGGSYPLTPINVTLLTTSDYLDLAVTNGVTYYYVVTAVDSATPTPNESGDSSEVSATPDSFQTVSVLSIDMAVVAGKKTYATATVAITPGLDGATVVGDWYFTGALRTSGATAVTNGSGIAEFTSFETPAKSGDTFMFMVTDIVASGYIYDESSNVETSDSIAVP